MPFLTKKIYGQALYFALLISTIAALSLVAVLLLSYTYNFFNTKSNTYVQLQKSSKELFLSAFSKEVALNDTIIKANSYGGEFKLYQSFYGCWKKSVLKSEKKAFKVNALGLVGTKTDRSTPNFYLKNTNSSLILVGKTKISGNAYVPDSGVRAGIIQGDYYQGSRLIYGLKYRSQKELPKLDKKWLRYLKDLRQGNYKEGKLVSLQKEIKNSFLNEKLVVEAFGSVTIGENILLGNIIVRSNVKITILESAEIKDVLFIAPEIEIKSNVKGRFQCIASRQIKVGKNSVLSFPSSLVVDDRDRTEESIKEHKIDLVEGVILEGEMVYLKSITKKRVSNAKAQIKVAPNSKIIGEIYNEGSIEFLGGISGSIYTNATEINAYGSKYINHLFNCTVNKFPTGHYGGLPFEKKTDYYLAKWLY